MRFVTHKDVDDAGLARAVAVARRTSPAPASLTATLGRMAASAEIPATRARGLRAPRRSPRSRPGGTLAQVGGGRHARCGCSSPPAATRATQDPDADLDALAALRVEETAKAAALLGFAGHFHLDYPDGELPDDQELRGAIVRVVRELAPEVVLCPDPTAVFFGDGYFNHHDHRVTGWATLDAVAPAAGNPHYFPEHLAEGLAVHQVRAVYLSGTLEPNCWIDIGDTLERKIDALVLPRQPARRRRRLVPRVPARARRGGRRRRGHAVRGGVPALTFVQPDAARAVRLRTRRASGGGFVAAPLGHRPQHEHRDDADAARRRSIEPMNVPSERGDVGVASPTSAMP